MRSCHTVIDKMEIFNLYLKYIGKIKNRDTFYRFK